MEPKERVWLLHTQEVRGSSPCAPTILPVVERPAADASLKIDIPRIVIHEADESDSGLGSLLRTERSTGGLRDQIRSARDVALVANQGPPCPV